MGPASSRGVSRGLMSMTHNAYEEAYQSILTTLVQRTERMDDAPQHKRAREAVREWSETHIEEGDYSLAFGVCLYSQNGPSHHFSSYHDGNSPEDVVRALAECSLVNDILEVADGAS